MIRSFVETALRRHFDEIWEDQLATQLIRETRVDLQLDDASLEGHLAIPEDPRGIVIFAHGSGSSRHSPRNRAVARHLREARLATLLFDLLTEGEQLADTVDAVTRRWETAGMKIGLFGASTGAAAALIAAAERTDEVAAVVSRGGRPDLASESLTQVLAPTLLIVGEMDPDVIDLNRAAYEQLAAEKRFDIVSGATHLFVEPGALEKVADLATEWFVRYVRPKNISSVPGIDSSAKPERSKKYGATKQTRNDSDDHRR